MPVNTRGNKDNSKVAGTRNKGKKPEEPTTSTSQSQEEDSATEDSEQESEQESEASSSASAAQESEPSSPANTIEEVESLNTLFTLLDVSDKIEDKEEPCHADEPSKEDLIKTLQHQEKLLQNRTQCQSTLLIRFRSAKWRLDKIQLEESVKDDALTKLRNLKDKTLQALSKEADELEKEITVLRKSLKVNHGYEEYELSRQSALKPASQEPDEHKNTVKWSQSSKEHAAIHRIFNEDYIPIHEETGEVDYSKIRKKIFKGAPMLDLDVSKFPIEDMIRELATRVINFRDKFERFYLWNLTDVLFDKMAWDYFGYSISENHGLSQDYAKNIAKFELLESDLADVVLRTRPRKGETVRAFEERLRPLLEAAEFPDDGCGLLIKALGRYLSDTGFQATIKEYGAFSKVKSMKGYLEFLANTPGAFDGTRTDHTLWFITKYGGKTPQQVMERLKPQTKTEQEGKPNHNLRHKKPRFQSEPSKEDVDKKPMPDIKICTYNDKCQRRRLRHSKEDCFHWQRDNGIEPPSRNDKTKKDNKRPFKSVGAFTRERDEDHLEAINVGDAMFFSSYSSPLDNMKSICAFNGPAPGDNRVAIPIGIQGQVFTALLDTGATTSLLKSD
ncbi:hypothetical protein B0O80DRAFT_491676 [Mortierella sp. GBAus27b]|nr:hypothetical protein B0O80DRAFT_491676 [Mortierella sp. GBAus27b]